jgi:hypothetical protein
MQYIYKNGFAVFKNGLNIDIANHFRYTITLNCNVVIRTRRGR